MKKATVKATYGFYSPRLAFENAKHKVNMGCVRPLWPRYRLVKIYYCKECDKLEREYISKQKKRNEFDH